MKSKLARDIRNTPLYILFGASLVVALVLSLIIQPIVWFFSNKGWKQSGYEALAFLIGVMAMATSPSLTKYP